MLLDADTLGPRPAHRERSSKAEAGGEFAGRVIGGADAVARRDPHAGVPRRRPRSRSQLRRLRRHVVERGRGRRLRLGSAGRIRSASSSVSASRAVTATAMLSTSCSTRGGASSIFGLHVHAAVDDPDKAIRSSNALRAHLCELLALSANSPFWRGEPTGFASCRHLIFSAFPRSGVPPHFGSYEEFAELVGRLVAAGCIEDYTRIWWDIRLHPRFGTVELRICDAVTASRTRSRWPPTPGAREMLRRPTSRRRRRRASTAIATGEQVARGPPRPRGAVMDLVRAGGAACLISQLIERTLRDLEPHARELGCERELEGIAAILRAATAPRSSSASGTRTATSPRSSRSWPRDRGRRVVH